jgi:hypothetical protein
MIEAKALRPFNRIDSLFKSERISANIKLILHKTLISSVMTYASPAWELAADTYLLKFQCLQTSFSAPFEIVQGVHRSVICTRFSIYRIYTII